MPSYLVEEIYESAFSEKVIGYAVFSGNEKSFDNLVGLISKYDFRDSDYDDDVSFLEWWFSSTGDSLNSTYFLVRAFSQLSEYDPDTRYSTEIKSMFFHLASDTVSEQVVERFISEIVSFSLSPIVSPILEDIARTLGAGPVEQLIVNPLFEFLYGEIRDKVTGATADYLLSQSEDTVTVFVNGEEAYTYTDDQDLAIIVQNSGGEVTTSSGNDLIAGSMFSDEIASGAGSDTIHGGSGNDILQSGAGSDVVLGGKGADNILGGAGSDSLDGGAGDDVIDARADFMSGDSIDAGSGDDTVYAGGATDYNRYGDSSIDGGAGADLLIVEARGIDDETVDRGHFRHRFDDRTVLNSGSSFEAIETAIASGGLHQISPSWWDAGRSTRNSWITETNFEHVEYRGGDLSDLFVDWQGNLSVALGGEGNDAVYADWSGASVDITWDLTTDNDMRKTLANGVEVQSIERLLLKTGSGDDQLILLRQSNHVETGAGNDVIDARADFMSGDSIDAGSGDDTVYAGGATDYNRYGDSSIDGGAGADLLIVEARGIDDETVDRGHFRHRFDDRTVLNSGSSFEAIETAIASGGLHQISPSWWDAGRSTRNSWITETNFEHVEYRGGDLSDLFVDWQGNLSVALGGEGNDAVYADWSGASVDITWDLTTDNDTRKTLANGVEVQSIERLLLKTGSGDDQLILLRQSNHVETGAGNDVIDARADFMSGDSIDAGSGDDTVYAGGATDYNRYGDSSIDGGAGADLLIVEARGIDDETVDRGHFRHRFDDRTVLNSGSSFEAIETAIASGGLHQISPSWWDAGRSTRNSWITETNFEHVEYRGGDLSDLFVDWQGNLSVALGGEGNDAVYADWSGASVDITWDLTTDNDTRKTLANGVEVQSIERLLLKTGSGDDHITLGRYDDYAQVGFGDNLVLALAGNDYISAFGGNDELYGGTGNDTLFAGAGNDSVGGSAGADQIGGGAGDDELWGGAGNDSIYGGIGSDTIGSGSEHDEVGGGGGNDTIWAGAGNDTVYGNDGNDELTGGNGQDLIYAGTGNDTIYAGDGDDTIGGVVGDDELWMGAGNDAAYGWTGNDTLLGLAGDDDLWGGNGNDVLDGGAGNDTLRGGADADALKFSTGNDRVIGFGGEDLIDLSNVAAITSFADLQANHLSGGTEAVISDGLGNSLTLVGVGVGALEAGDFVF